MNSPMTNCIATGSGPRPTTLTQKIIARAAGRHSVSPGEIVMVKVDLAMMHDSGGPRRVKPLLERLNTRVWDPDRVVVITDHYVPAYDTETQQIQTLTHKWVKEQGINAFYDQQGICHVVLPERGHLHPGMLVVGGDSHSPTGGAFGAYMFGIGATEMAGVLATGETWLQVPETLLIEWQGALTPGVSAKDMMLYVCAKLGMNGAAYQAVQYAGEAVRALSMQERMTLANMTAELGGQAGLIEPDATTAAWLKSAGADIDDFSAWHTDPGAPLMGHHRLNANDLTPQVAAPHSPANAAPVGDYGPESIDVAYIGACTGAKLADLRMAARILKGQRIASNTQLLIAPASVQDQQQAAAEGTLGALLEAGARLLSNSCGICAGYGADRLPEDAVCISSTARNFRGRMGAASSRVFLASPYTVAASAIAGHITDPRPYLPEYRD